MNKSSKNQNFYIILGPTVVIRVPYMFIRLDNTYTGFACSTAVIRSGSSVVGEMTIARRLEAVRANSHIFFKSMTCLTEGLAGDDHGLIFIVETSFSVQVVSAL